MTTPQPQFRTREEWLLAAVTDLRPLFRGQNLVIPEIVHVSIGWPSSGGLGVRRRTFGQCWDAVQSTDQSHHIFISPLLDQLIAKGGKLETILNVLTHELVHAAVGVQAKHGPRFATACRRLGFEGKPTSNYPGPVLEVRLFELAERLGTFPDLAALRPAEKVAKKQTTRMRKAECETCGYLIRTTRQWLSKWGPPLCPNPACKSAPLFAEPPEGEETPEDTEEGFQ